MKHKKKIITISVILLILILTNPSTKRFCEFMYSKNISLHDVSYGRENNFVIFSIYNYNGGFVFDGKTGLYYSANKKYLGIFENFFEL